MATGKSREPFVGTLSIFPVRYFGHWRVLVCKLARTARDQENTLTAIRADNWRELEPAARQFLLDQGFSLKCAGLYMCPRTIARRAHWQQWAQANITRPAKALPNQEHAAK